MFVAERSEGAPGAPLILTFHGTGGTETQFHRLARDLVPGAHVTSPRGDVSERGALRFFRRIGAGDYDYEDLARRTAAMAAFVAEERTARAASETFGLGYSNGANILASVALEQGDLFDRLMLLHPLIPWAPRPQPRLAGKRILLTAGERDPICPGALTREFLGYLRDQGAEVTDFWHPGGHEIAQGEIDAIQAFLAE